MGQKISNKWMNNNKIKETKGIQIGEEGQFLLFSGENIPYVKNLNQFLQNQYKKSTVSVS